MGNTILISDRLLNMKLKLADGELTRKTRSNGKQLASVQRYIKKESTDQRL